MPALVAESEADTPNDDDTPVADDDSNVPDDDANVADDDDDAGPDDTNASPEDAAAPDEPAVLLPTAEDEPGASEDESTPPVLLPLDTVFDPPDDDDDDSCPDVGLHAERANNTSTDSTRLINTGYLFCLRKAALLLHR